MYVLLVISKVLVIIGGLNWGLIGIFNFNQVESLFGVDTVATQVVYILVGVAALLTVIDLFWRRKPVPVAPVREREQYVER